MPNKLSPRIRSFLLEIKKKHPKLSCRKACRFVERKFLVKISKSRVNLLWKEKELSQPVGRIPTKQFVLKTQFENAGFLFLMAADTQLQTTKILAENMAFMPSKSSQLSTQKGLQVLIYKKLFPDSKFWTINRYNYNDSKLLRISRAVEDYVSESVDFFDKITIAQQEIASIDLIREDEIKLVLDGQLRSLCLGAAPESFARPLNIVKEEVRNIF